MQNELEQLSTKLITLKKNIIIDRSRLLEKLNRDYDIKLNTSQLKIFENSNNVISMLIEQISKKKLNRTETKYIDKFFDDYKIERENSQRVIEELIKLSNELVYKLYGLNDDEIKIIESEVI